MIHRSNREVEKAYRNAEDASQSRLKLIMGGVGLYNNTEPEEKYYSEKQHFILGNGVDTIITMGKEVFKKEYYVSTLENKPSASIMSIVQEVYDIESEKMPHLSPLDFSDERGKEVILEVSGKQEFQKNWKPETKYNKIIEQGQDYWNDLIASKGRQILSLEQYETIVNITASIFFSPYTAKYFEDSKDVDIYYQIPLHFKYDIDCKALLDMVIINHRDKTIQPIDIKTMGDYTMNFPIAFFRRRYDIQAAFYTEAVIRSNRFIEYSKYNVLPFKFIVESTVEQGNPLVYTCTDEILDRGKYGVPSKKIEGHVLRGREGFIHGIKLYKWHLENGFEQDKVVVENEGNLLLTLEGIVK
tara:strand:- start:31393 stop:32463 length:1071 start_codon:yes stop_codon:yes gene_type:complete